MTIATGVSQWNDASGQGNNVIQATPANQPGYSAGGGPNGLDALTFNGTTTQLSKAAVSLLAAQRGTYFLVLKAGVTSTQTILDDEGTNCKIGISTGHGVANARAIDTNGGTCADTTSNATTVWEAWTVQKTLAPLESMRVNGAAHTLNNSNFTSTGGAGGVWVGSNSGPGNWFTGSLNRVLVYDRVLSGAEIARVEAYLRQLTAIW